jgi:hypothetical protein
MLHFLSFCGKHNEDLWLWDVEKGSLQGKWSTGLKMAEALAFTNDGRTIVVDGGKGNLPGLRLNSGKVAFLDAATGKRLAYVTAREDTVGGMALSPDGKQLAVSTNPQSKQ